VLFQQPTEAEDGGFVRDSLKAPAKEIQEFVFPSGSSQASYAPPWTPNSQMYLAVLIALRCRYVVIMTNTSNKISSPACNSQKDLALVGVVVADCCRSLPAAVGPECVKTPGHILAMISENFIAREAHETVYPG